MSATANSEIAAPAQPQDKWLPAEWAPQDAVMMTWPRNDGDFGSHFADVEREFIDIAVAIARFEPLRINTAEHAAKLRERLLDAGVESARLRIFELPSDDVWVRDHGPITVFENGQRCHLNFHFDGWGHKYPADRDNNCTSRLSQLGAWRAPVQDVDQVLEGGAIEVDGCGTLMTTRRCLLSARRNPGMDQGQTENMLCKQFGVKRILWLAHGELEGDDTDGHIDTLARFCDAHTIAYQACDDPDDAHYDELNAMAEELRSFRSVDNNPYDLLPLPLPPSIHGDDGHRLPAGYANFLIINGAVLVPAYGVAQDAEARARLASCFKKRKIISLSCRHIVEQNGSLHCATMQIPADAATRQ